METNGPTKIETLLGGRGPVTVQFTDGSTQEVTVRQLPISEMPRLAATIEDETAQAELYCGKPKGWAAKLTTESHEQIVVEGERLNADFFARWVARRARRQEILVPGITEQMKRSLLSSLPMSSPSSPSAQG